MLHSILQGHLAQQGKLGHYSSDPWQILFLAFHLSCVSVALFYHQLLSLKAAAAKHNKTSLLFPFIFSNLIFFDGNLKKSFSFILFLFLKQKLSVIYIGDFFLETTGDSDTRQTVWPP